MTMKMTMAEFVGLEPCPFCGGEAEVFFTEESGMWDVQCQKCGAMPFVHKQEESAIAAWNSRAEMSYEDALILLDELGLSERTCECVAEYAQSPIDGKTIVLHRCSACHELMRPTMRYCPSCGARIRKVVGE